MSSDPMAYIHQTAVHQLRQAADEIESGQGIIGHFDYEQDIDEYYEQMPGRLDDPKKQRTVSMEVEFILPE